MSSEGSQQEFMSELDQLAERVEAVTPDYKAPPFSPKRLMALVEQLLAKLPKQLQLDVLKQLRGSLTSDLFDLDTWKGAWYLINYTLNYNAGMVKRHYTGEYETDEWGLDWEFVDAVLPFFRFLYRFYWRVQATGLENVPIDGRALLVCNHSGQLPWDGSMVAGAVMFEHPARRLVRGLYSRMFPGVPFVSSWLPRLGQTLATVDNGARMLEQGELVAVFPESHKGIGKTYKQRYQLARFGRGGFVKMALAAQAPVIPVSVVGAEETYISLVELPAVATILGIPFFPITPTFPWLGPLGFVPLPTKWYIDFGAPIPTDGYGPDPANNPVLVSQLSDRVRNLVQEMIRDRLAQRRSVFW